MANQSSNENRRSPARSSMGLIPDVLKYIGRWVTEDNAVSVIPCWHHHSSNSDEQPPKLMDADDGDNGNDNDQHEAPPASSAISQSCSSDSSSSSPSVPESWCKFASVDNVFRRRVSFSNAVTVRDYPVLVLQEESQRSSSWPRRHRDSRNNSNNCSPTRRLSLTLDWKHERETTHHIDVFSKHRESSFIPPRRLSKRFREQSLLDDVRDNIVTSPAYADNNQPCAPEDANSDCEVDDDDATLPTTNAMAVTKARTALPAPNVLMVAKTRAEKLLELLDDSSSCNNRPQQQHDNNVIRWAPFSCPETMKQERKFAEEAAANFGVIFHVM